jgi:hypothetical protein
MTVEEWGIVIGVLASAVLAITPWMLMVQANLAALSAKISGLETKVDKLIDDNENRIPLCAVHTARLDSFEQQLGDIHERLTRLTDDR